MAKVSVHTDTTTITVVRHKIIKLTYLQTLAVTGGLSSAVDVAGETQATDTVIDKHGNVKSSIGGVAVGSSSKTDKFGAGAGAAIGFGIGGPIGAAIGAFVGKNAKGIMGKDVSTEVTHSIKDGGWKVTKSWLQPEFDKIKLALGVKELTIAQFQYEQTSEIVSTPWASPKDIQKVSLIVDEFIPKEFPPGGNYIEYYVRPESENSKEWVRINPLGTRTVFDDTGTVIPRIVNLNSERPVASKLEETFIETESEVRQVRFRAVLKRPTSLPNATAESYTPILKSYRLFIHPRGGL